MFAKEQKGLSVEGQVNKFKQVRGEGGRHMGKGFRGVPCEQVFEQVHEW